MVRKVNRKNSAPRTYVPEVPAMAKKHPVKKTGHNMHIPADLRALGITSMRDFTTS